MPFRAPSAGTTSRTVGALVVAGGLLGLAGGTDLFAPASAPPRAAAAVDRRPAVEPVEILTRAPESPEARGTPSPTPDPPPTRDPAPAPAEGVWGQAVPLGQAAEAVPAALPVSVSVPAIDVTSDLVDLEVLADGTLEAPDTAGQAGWFAAGVRPGEPGPAIIAGHVDLGGSPGVFHRLEQVLPGDEVEVRDADGAAHVFTVDRVERHAKEAFPTDAVYGPEPGPVLRLVTCGGTFDRGTGHYRDNVIVTARLG